ncbi:cyclic peptide export ABC transporter [Trichocoleus sp. FACHB-262]|uniref:cyclic peptide export ABC transporter n=1 Tax=Trichocoleus sp. FACHB-262 TaxID=2692869 RepID=UPI0016841B00|nr:cyclic peptide export ABC transporter [Trichocoleus sp. FACHB-262]MBD2121925.1 cyclic peptide export ABC transporter [Trichocoleus sp. FACHB-262]
MNLVYLLLKTSWVSVLLAMLTGLLGGASSTGLIALTNTSLTSQNPPTAALMRNFASLGLVLLLTTIASQILLARLAQGSIFELRLLLSRQILASPLRQLEALGASRLLATLTDDIQSVANALFSFPVLCIDIAILVSCLTYLAWLSLSVFGLMMLVLAIVIASLQVIISRARKALSLARKEQDNLLHHFQAIITGIKELKLHYQRRQSFLTEDLYVTATAARDHNIAGMTTFAIAGGYGLLATFLIIGLLLFALPRFISTSPEILSGYALVALYLMLPFQGILGVIPVLSRATVALDAIQALGLALSEHATEATAIAPPPPNPAWQRLDLVDVTHAYRGEREEDGFSLGPLSLSFQPGEVVFLVGGNGSGKSTLAKLITGLYSPEAGELKLDGQPITDANREWYRQHFSVVFADFYLFDRLLGLGDRADLDPQAKEYLIQLHLDHKVRVQDGTLSTTTLSQGQRKRLALLTAYLEDRPIYLFDEWASDQDPIFKEIFYTQLLPELKQRGKSVLVISHDDHYFHLADRIVKLDYGKLEYDKRIAA